MLISYYIKGTLFISLLFLQQTICADEVLANKMPIVMVYNPGPDYSLINSIDYHPHQPIFCVTYTHNNKVILYKINDEGRPKILQVLGNPLANLNQPQHAVFSPDGNKMVVANWLNQTITVYQKDRGFFFQSNPLAVIPPPNSLINHKPHGIAFSPCGNYLAIAYGAAAYHGKAVALFSVTQEGRRFELIDMLQGPDELPGIPKGITFSPDGTCLLVTFSDANSLVIYTLYENNRICQTPRQVIQGEESGIFRPEDVKITSDGKYCAVTNSDHNTVTFYPFDKDLNTVTQNVPCEILQNPEASFHFPHGITFSPDGAFMLVTEFGHIHTTEEGDVIWDHHTKPEQSKFNVYKMLKSE
jgi:DNA-binding beta-propeller fold protein YncE